MKLKFTNKMKGANKFNNKADIVENRQCLSADGFSLLPSALRPCLFLLLSIVGITIASVVNIYGGLYSEEVFAYSASMTTSGNKSIDASAAGNGVTIGSDAITVTTDCKAGYNLTMSTSVDNNNLYLNGDIANNTTGTYFTPADGITTLGNSTNTWGYYYNRSNNAAPTKTNIFSAIPTSSSTPATLVTTTDSASESDISDSFNVYYGVSVNTNLVAGTYKMIPKTNNGNDNGTITYYLTMAESCAPYLVQFSPTSTANNTTISGTGTMNGQTIPTNEATALNANTFTAPNGYEFKEWNTEQNGTGTAYTDQQSVTNLTTPGNTITLYAQWEALCPAGNICYKDNGANSVTKMGDQNIGTSATEATLWASNFQRSGYGFLGWSTKANPVIGTDTIYGPMETISNINVSQGGIKLYAVWKAAETTMVGETTTPVYLQDWNGCNNLTAATYNSTTGKITVAQNSFIALTDKRDDQVYAIARLADGACWMIENLRLDTAGTVGNNKHNNSITNRSLAQGYGDVFAGLADPETANFSSSNAANSLYYIGTQSGTATININQNYSTSSNYRMPRYRNDNTVLAEGETDTTTGNSVDTYAYGNYYTWAAAIADTTLYTSNEHTTVATSICPSGWHLPYGNSGSSGSNLGNTKGGFYYLNQQMGKYTNGDGSKEFRSFPNNFLYSGNADSGNINRRGDRGYYWSSSALSDYSAYFLYLRSSNLYPGTGSSGKYYGFTVRCVVGS